MRKSAKSEEKCDFNGKACQIPLYFPYLEQCAKNHDFREIFENIFAKIALSQNLTISYRKSMILGAIFALFALLRKSAKSRTFLAQVEK